MLGDLPLMDFMRTKMKWHQNRQSVLASNVANSDTPNYQPKDLKPLSFNDHMAVKMTAPVQIARTHSQHMNVVGLSRDNGFGDMNTKDFETTPSGNAVVLEDQMIKVAGNQFDYQLATSVYSRSLGLLKTALGKA